MPSFGGRDPQIAIERLKNINGNNAKCILVCVYGNRAYDDTLVEMQDTANSQKFQIIAAITAIAQHSIINEYAKERPDRQDEVILTKFTQDILNKNKEKIAPIPGHRPYKKISKTPIIPQPNKNCIKCGLCAKMCPVNAINPITFKTNPQKCISCMRCIKLCPKNVRKVNQLIVKIAAQAIKKECQTRKSPELFLTNKILEQ